MRLLMGALAGVEATVHVAGEVPVGAQCPYVTLSAAQGFGEEGGTLTVDCWTRGTQLDALRLADRAAELAGVLRGENGAVYLRLTRREALHDVRDRSLVGARLRFDMRTYGMEDTPC